MEWSWKAAQSIICHPEQRPESASQKARPLADHACSEPQVFLLKGSFVKRERNLYSTL